MTGLDAGSARTGARLVAMGIFWSALVLLFAEAASRLPLAAPADWDAATTAAAPPLARFDSGWYLQIATKG